MLLLLKWPLFPAKGQMGREAQLCLIGLVAEHLDWVPVRGSEGCHCVLQELLSERQCQFILALVALMERNVRQGACGTCLSFFALLVGIVPAQR